MNNKIKDKDLKKVSGGRDTSTPDTTKYQKVSFPTMDDNNYLFQIGQTVKYIHHRTRWEKENVECSITGRCWKKNTKWDGSISYSDYYTINCKYVTANQWFCRAEFSKE